MLIKSDLFKLLAAGFVSASWMVAPVAQADSAKPQYMNPEGMYDASVHGYSQVTVVNTPAKLVYTAGQGGADAEGKLSKDFGEQVEQAFKNLNQALAAAGADFSDVVKVNVYIVDHSMERLDIFETAMKKMLDGKPGPSSTLVPVPALALPEMQFEINAVAAVNK